MDTQTKGHIVAKIENTETVETSTAVEVVNTNTGELALGAPASLHEAQVAFARFSRGDVAVASTLVNVDRTGLRTVAKAVSSALPLGDFLNTPLEMENIVVQHIELEVEKATADGGTIKVKEPAVRTIVLTTDGKAYGSVSKMVYSAFDTLFGILGYPHTWGGVPERIVVSREKAKVGHFYKVSLAD